jgi:hypothetical protein
MGDTSAEEGFRPAGGIQSDENDSSNLHVANKIGQQGGGGGGGGEKNHDQTAPLSGSRVLAPAKDVGGTLVTIKMAIHLAWLYGHE